jgi:hypothetical protein
MRGDYMPEISRIVNDIEKLKKISETDEKLHHISEVSAQSSRRKMVYRSMLQSIPIRHRSQWILACRMYTKITAKGWGTATAE